MSGHTPGPWKIRKCSCGVCRDFWVEPPGMFCQGSGFNEDDARLVSAAPDLLESCKALLKKCEHYLGPMLAGGEMSEARDAIAKAEGTE